MREDGQPSVPPLRQGTRRQHPGPAGSQVEEQQAPGLLVPVNRAWRQVDQ